MSSASGLKWLRLEGGALTSWYSWTLLLPKARFWRPPRETSPGHRVHSHG